MIKKLFKYGQTQALFLFVLALVLLLSLTSYSQSDPSFNLSTGNEPQNLLGYPGACLADLIYQFIGIASFTIPAAFIRWTYVIYKVRNLRWKWLKIISLGLGFLCAAAFLNIFKINSLPAGGGGLVGTFLLKNGVKFLALGEEIIYLGSALLSLGFLVIAFGIEFSTYMNSVLFLRSSIDKIRIWMKIPGRLKVFNPLQTGIAGMGARVLKEPVAWQYSKEKPPTSRLEPAIEKPSMENRSFHQQTPYVAQAPLRAEKEEGVNALPATSLLEEARNQHIELQSPAELQQKAEKLLVVLGDFGVRGKITDIKQGPVVTMYEFEPAAGTKSSRVIGLSDDIARSLSAHSTRIAVIPGRNALGIELPNRQRMFFRLRELIDTPQFQDPDVILPLILGKDLGGSPLIADLAKMPHLLVAGTTGSGKSVAINAMIMSLLYRYTPEECKMIMIDPKMLELSAYDNIPHLMTPVVTEPGKAVVALKWAVKEMENRYRLMSHLGVRNIANFNAKILDAASEGRTLERRAQTGFDSGTGKPVFESVPIDMRKMPFIVVIVDEMADLMLVAGKDIETSIQRLAQMARAAGIHIIMATQRPSVDVITGVIKANFPSRISFKVTSKIDSRTILGEQGAEQLLGMGDMLYMGNSSRILRVHGPFVDDKEVERVTDFLRSTGAPEYISAVTEVEEDFSYPGGDESEGEEIYKQAVDIVRNERKASISYIQRALRIGYNRAANIVEEMEKNGILSAPNQAGKREVLLPEN